MLTWQRIEQPGEHDPMRDRMVRLLSADWCGTLIWDPATGKVYRTHAGHWYVGVYVPE